MQELEEHNQAIEIKSNKYSWKKIRSYIIGIVIGYILGLTVMEMMLDESRLDYYKNRYHRIDRADKRPVSIIIKPYYE